MPIGYAMVPDVRCKINLRDPGMLLQLGPGMGTWPDGRNQLVDEQCRQWNAHPTPSSAALCLCFSTEAIPARPPPWLSRQNFLTHDGEDGTMYVHTIPSLNGHNTVLVAFDNYLANYKNKDPIPPFAESTPRLRLP